MTPSALLGLSDQAIIALWRGICAAESATADQKRNFEIQTGWQADAYLDRFREWQKKQEEKKS